MPGWWSEYTRLKVRRSNLTLPAYGLHSQPTRGRAGKCRSVRVAARSRSRLRSEVAQLKLHVGWNLELTQHYLTRSHIAAHITCIYSLSSPRNSKYSLR